MKSLTYCMRRYGHRSLSSWRAWIEIGNVVPSRRWKASLSSWRAWIEIWSGPCRRGSAWSLSSWRAWIEMPRRSALRSEYAGRSPHGERGLKFRFLLGIRVIPHMSLSSWRAWIEIYTRFLTFCPSRRSPHGERGLKSSRAASSRLACLSLSSWRAWIEITSRNTRS